MKTFPCWACKGKGGWSEYIDGFLADHDECDYCEGNGVIEIGSDLHKRIKEKQLYYFIWTKFAPKDFNPTDEEGLVFDKRLREIIHELKELFYETNTID